MAAPNHFQRAMAISISRNFCVALINNNSRAQMSAGTIAFLSMSLQGALVGRQHANR